MSVIKAKRDSGKLAVLTKARELAAYTVKICKNESNFPKRDRWILTQRIVGEALDAYMCIRKANSIRVERAEDYHIRRSEQMSAHAHIDALLGVMDIAYEVLNIDNERIEHWTGLAVDADDLLVKWTRSDKEKYANMRES